MRAATLLSFVALAGCGTAPTTAVEVPAAVAAVVAAPPPGDALQCFLAGAVVGLLAGALLWRVALTPSKGATDA